MTMFPAYIRRISKFFQIILFVPIVCLLLLFVYFHVNKIENYYYNSQQRTTFKIIDEAEKFDKWIVMTTINYPTAEVRRYSQMSSEWRLVVVADRKTPNDWQNKDNPVNCVFLSLEMQQKLNYKIMQLIPENSYTKKIIGYLYAIEHGAKWIYDTDDDNGPYGRGLQQFDINESTISGLVYGSDLIDENANSNLSNILFNPYAYWGRADIWPRGYPLEHIQSANHRNNFHLCKSLRTPIIQQGLVAKDPDVDAIFRLINADRSSGLNMTFDRNAPTITLLNHVYAPFNSQNTLFHYDAFWSLLLPITVPFRVCDIWRGYYAEKLLHLLQNDSFIGFYPINAIQKRNAHSYLADFKDEWPLYADAARMIEYLAKWKCNYDVGLSGCMLKLSNDFVAQQFWQYDDYRLTSAWIDDLQSFGYRFPNIRSSSSPHQLHPSAIVDERYANCRPAYYLAKNQNKDRSELAIDYFHDLENWCNADETNADAKFKFLFTTDGIRFESNMFENLSNIVLVIYYNRKLQSSMSLLQRLYAPYFANTIFCGEYNESWVARGANTFPPLLPFSVISITSAEIDNGAYAYICMSKAYEMRIENIIGYVVMADDTVYNFYHNIDLHRYQMQSHVTMGGYFWGHGGKEALHKAINLIKQRIAADNASRLAVAWREYSRNVGGNGSMTMLKPNVCGYVDWFYVPANQSFIYYELAEVLAECKVWIELAVPRIGAGMGFLDEFNAFIRFRTVSATILSRFDYNFSLPKAKEWSMKADFANLENLGYANKSHLGLWANRGNWTNFYNKNLISLHPVKFTFTGRYAQHRSHLCKFVVQRFHDFIFSSVSPAVDIWRTHMQVINEQDKKQ